MNYQTFQPHSDLSSVVKCYWTLEVPAEDGPQRQRILPDGCIELIFLLGDDVKRILSGNVSITQPRTMVIGQITEPFIVEPTGQVNSFAVRFYPYGFASFVSVPIKDLTNKETPLECLLDKQVAEELEQKIVQAADTGARIMIIEDFLLNRLKNKATIDTIVKTTIDIILSTKGTVPVNTILNGELSKRRQLERKFLQQVGLSPKQLCKVIRLQTALRMILHPQAESLTRIAYESEYYDQAHFTKDFHEFTGSNPKDFLDDEQMLLSSLFYKQV